MRSGQPLTVFVQSNRSRSQWNPSIGPGIGLDRPSYAPGYGPDNAVLGRRSSGSIRRRSCCSRRGRSATPAAAISPGRTSARWISRSTKRAAWPALGGDGRVEIRLEAFNVLNRANFGPPALIAFAGHRHDQRTAALDFRPHHDDGDLVAADSARREGPTSNAEV